MITVAILINGNPLMTRSAVNIGKQTPDGSTIYRVDTGEQVLHKREEGAAILAIKLLKTIKEDNQVSFIVSSF